MKINNKGFSMFELLVGVFVVIMIMLVSLPLINSYQKITKLRSEARELASNLRLAQQLAVSEQVIYNIVISQNTNSYEVKNSVTSDLVKSVTLISEVTIQDVTGFTDDIIQFNATGAVIETGSVIFTNTNSAISTIEIKPSGYVQISD